MSQVERLKEVLIDGCWHDTPEILERVYGASHLGIARISARIYDISKTLPTGLTVESRKKKGNETVWEYRLAEVDTERPALPRADLFGHAAEAV